MTQASMDLLTDALEAGVLIMVAGITTVAIIKAGPKIAVYAYSRILSFIGR